MVVVLRAERGQDLALGRADKGERRHGAVLEAPGTGRLYVCVCGGVCVFGDGFIGMGLGLLRA